MCLRHSFINKHSTFIFETKLYWKLAKSTTHNKCDSGLFIYIGFEISSILNGQSFIKRKAILKW